MQCNFRHQLNEEIVRYRVTDQQVSKPGNNLVTRNIGIFIGTTTEIVSYSEHTHKLYSPVIQLLSKFKDAV